MTLREVKVGHVTTSCESELRETVSWIFLSLICVLASCHPCPPAKTWSRLSGNPKLLGGKNPWQKISLSNPGCVYQTQCSDCELQVWNLLIEAGLYLTQLLDLFPDMKITFNSQNLHLEMLLAQRAYHTQFTSNHIVA